MNQDSKMTRGCFSFFLKRHLWHDKFSFLRIWIKLAVSWSNNVDDESDLRHYHLKVDEKQLGTQTFDLVQGPVLYCRYFGSRLKHWDHNHTIVLQKQLRKKSNVKGLGPLGDDRSMILLQERILPEILATTKGTCFSFWCPHLRRAFRTTVVLMTEILD